MRTSCASANRCGAEQLLTLRLTGAAIERGRAHGEELREPIAAGLAAWEDVNRPADGTTLPEQRAAFLARLDVEDALEQWVPGQLDEIRGIAQGANQPYERVLFYNLRAEWECWQAGLVADLPHPLDGSTVLLDVDEPGRPRALLLTAAGAVGFGGANEAGVAVCCNALPTLRAATHGVTVLGCVRGILRARSVDEAERFLVAAPIATPQRYLVGDSGGVLGFECCARRVVAVEPEDGTAWHTDHPLANGDPDVLAVLPGRTVFERAW